MKMTVLASAAALALMASPALAQSGNYIQGNLGLNFAGQSDLNLVLDGDSYKEDLDLETGVFASAAFGHKFANKWSVEGEFVYLDTDVDVGTFEDILSDYFEEDVKLDIGTKVYGVMANANYEFYRSANTALYAGAGIGYGKVEYKLAVPDADFAGSADDNGFMWQVKAGLIYDINEKTAFDFGYRYLSAPTGKDGIDGDSLSVDTSAHVLSAGMRFNF